MNEWLYNVCEIKKHMTLCEISLSSLWLFISQSGVHMEWSNDGELLAVAGYVRLPDQDCRNELRFYRRSTKLQLALVLPTQVLLLHTDSTATIHVRFYSVGGD